MTSPKPAPTSAITGQDAARAARNVSALMLASLLGKGALFAWQLALSTWLGPNEYGIYGTVGGLMVNAAAVAGFGMGMIAIRDVARSPAKAGSYWTAMLFAQTLLALLAYIGMNGVALGYSETVRAFAAVAGINLFIDLVGNMGHDLLLAQERMRVTSLVEVAHISLRISLALLALWLGWGLLGVYVASMFSGALRSMTLAALNFLAGVRPRFPLDRALLKPLLLNCAPLALASFLALAYAHADKLLTTGILSATVTGYLTVAFVINFGIIELFSSSVLVASYPLLARYYDGRNPAFGFMIEKLASYMLITGLWLALSLSILAEALVLPLLGEAYAPAAGILRLLIWYTGIHMFGSVLGQALLIQNRQRRLLLLRAASLALNVILTAALLLRWGDPRGAVVASILGEALLVALLLRDFRAPGWQLKAIADRGARLLLCGIPAGLIMLSLREQFPLLPLACGLALYLAGLPLTGALRSDDWDLLYRLAAAMPGGGLLLRFWKRDVELGW